MRRRRWRHSVATQVYARLCELSGVYTLPGHDFFRTARPCRPGAGFFDVYKATAPSTATLLRDKGYHTAYFGKWHCGVVKDQAPPAVLEHPEDYTRWPMRTPEYHRAGFQDWYGFEVNNAPFKGFYYHEHEVNSRRLDVSQLRSFVAS